MNMQGHLMNNKFCMGPPWARRFTTTALLLLLVASSHVAHADDDRDDQGDRDDHARQHVSIDDYRQAPGFALPSPGGPLDILPDGRIIVLSQTTVFRETAPRSRSFVALGTLPDADFSSFGASFLLVSPDGGRIAVGNNGGASFINFQVGIFALPSLAGTWYTANSDSAAWINDRYLALTAGTFGSPSIVTAFDSFSSDPDHPSNRTIIQNIGGASGGIAFDRAKNLYTGNAFSTTGPSTTGAVKAFAHADWLSALHGGPPIDFEAQGVLVVTVLDADPLTFDTSGNLFSGGGDLFGGGDVNFAALISKAAVRSALEGGGPVDTSDPRQVRKLDPDPAPRSSYDVIVNRVLDEVYLRSSGSVAFVFRAR